MPGHMRRLVPLLAGLASLGLLLGLRWDAPELFERLQLASFDAFQRAAPRAASAAPVLVVDIDDESLRRHGRWPWPRDVLAELVRDLQDLGAGAVALDMVFTEPDQTSPARLVGEWTRRFGFRAADAALPDYDATLAEAFARGRVVTGALLVESGGVPPAVKAPVATIGGDPSLTVTRFGGTVPNLPALDEAAAGHGSLSIQMRDGGDEVIRKVPLLMAAGDRLVPSLSLETLRVLQDEDTIKVRAERTGGVLTGYTIGVGDVTLALDPSGSLWLRYPERGSTRSVPAWRVLDAAERGRLGPTVKGAAVLVGTSALGLADLRPTPMTPFEPGVDLHAGVIEQALDGVSLVRPAWMPGAELRATLALGGLVALLAGFARARVTGLVVVALPAALILGAYALFDRAGLLAGPALPALGVVVAGLGAGLARYMGDERQAKRLRSAFTHYLSPDLVTALASDPGRLKLGGETRTLTFLFTDLEGFTSLTETRGAEALVHLLNGYLDGLCRIAMEHGGTVDKIVGDAMHVMFNAPLDQPDHAPRAVACALAIDAFAEAFRAAQRRDGVPFGATRIGVNTGRAVVGNFGGARRFDYTAHGDAINTAARLESANKALGTRICVAAETVARAAGQAFRPVGTLMLKGKSVGVEVFEPVVEGSARTPAYVDAFERLTRGEESGARDMVGLSAADPDDPVLALHARRIRAGELSTRMAA